MIWRWGKGGVLLGDTPLRRGKWYWTETHRAIPTKASTSSIESSGDGMDFRVVLYEAGSQAFVFNISLLERGNFGQGTSLQSRAIPCEEHSSEPTSAFILSIQG